MIIWIIIIIVIIAFFKKNETDKLPDTVLYYFLFIFFFVNNMRCKGSGLLKTKDNRFQYGVRLRLHCFYMTLFIYIHFKKLLLVFCFFFHLGFSLFVSFFSISLSFSLAHSSLVWVKTLSSLHDLDFLMIWRNPFHSDLFFFHILTRRNM